MFRDYMLRCVDRSYYIGRTDDLEYRLAQHHAGALPCYTLKRRPLELVFSQEFVTREEALAVERQLKGWSRAKKEALIRADRATINRLGRGRHRHERMAADPLHSNCVRKLRLPGSLGALRLQAFGPTLRANAVQGSDRFLHLFAQSVGAQRRSRREFSVTGKHVPFAQSVGAQRRSRRAATKPPAPHHAPDR
ncbi:GIY-YIG nuclease family protein [Lysobacter yangpyeongensis]|uniref:GIY-YIG nuclease family protein n=1 Tax=Lysobacter yangpyeongensis TaxID=346182 RepID=A0ABW0SQV2_9GAMM